ncbi:hypothetical protein [Spirosoma sp.]|uniref:hypothetical protein n=1 Tax=Spirosoma sp. TaxID=1899569 RepID=UPI003B3AB47D
MKQAPKPTTKDRQRIAQQLIEASKKPYLVQNMPKTVLYLTPEQASKRTDLIPQFTLHDC